MCARPVDSRYVTELSEVQAGPQVVSVGLTLPDEWELTGVIPATWNGVMTRKQ